MREILFRGKDSESGIWCYGDLSFDREGKPYIRFWAHNGYLVRAVDPETVGQFTGFFDKWNTRVFEGDILRSIYPDEPYEPAICYERVIWDDGCWCSVHKENAPDEIWQIDLTRYSKVVGNIFDNGGLLEVMDDEN